MEILSQVAFVRLESRPYTYQTPSMNHYEYIPLHGGSNEQYGICITRSTCVPSGALGGHMSGCMG